jgi:hypothetical protein
MPKQVTFIIDDEKHARARVYVDDKHLGYEASKAFDEWLRRREARTRRAEKEGGK